MKSWGVQSTALGVGAPLVTGMLEEAIALSCRKFVACGGAGVLDRSIAVGHLVVPTSAIRDEGTSYHCIRPDMPLGREVKPCQSFVRESLVNGGKTG